ncbi:hypothetical protein D9758_016766 [Tetrapyrgos nigripes]|uniref:Uncharacterized protein n=1 Tax=Tetrapyrgos nigripes TaxID=182062 RepID=A0A8H5FKB1_9AGAR|nr:hypothetical protein D9758_016766 [Tetrapyrgos nigripes]
MTAAIYHHAMAHPKTTNVSLTDISHTQMAVLWKDADENPNKGREPKPKKKKSDSATVAKDAASSSPPPSSPGLASSDD